MRSNVYLYGAAINCCKVSITIIGRIKLHYSETCATYPKLVIKNTQWSVSLGNQYTACLPTYQVGLISEQILWRSISILGHQDMRASGIIGYANYKYMKDVYMAYIIVMHTAQTIVADVDISEPLQNCARFLG